VNRGAAWRRTGTELHGNVPAPLPQASVIAALPSCSNRFEPQQYVSPSTVSAHVCSPPAVMAVNRGVSLILIGSA